MGFNYGLERKRFEREWAKLRKEYAEAGMSDDAIQQMYEYDLSVFNRKRADAKHEQPCVGKMCSDAEEDDESKSALFEKFTNELSYEDSYAYGEERFDWIESLTNEFLYEKVSSLSESDKELLTFLVEDGLTKREIAKMRGVTEQAIGQKIKRLKKLLSNV